ncbi:MAG: lysylphosphatidylglycerol synthase transmembrane domain-containing protein [Planctomycetota bacterium]
MHRGGIFAAAIGIYVIGQLIFVARWSLLLKVQSITIGFWPAVRLHFLGLFYNNCLPGAIGGDLPRAWYVTKHTDKKLEAALSVFVDRAVGLAGMLIMAFGCYWFIPEQSRDEAFDFSFEFCFLRGLSEHKRLLAGIGAAIALVIILAVSLPKGRAFLARAFGRIRRRTAVVLSKVRQSIHIYCHKWPAIVLALLLTFCCQSTHVIAMWLVGREIGIAAPAKYYFIFFPLSWLLGALPISVGGLGIMEGWLKVMFMQVGAISGKEALALALCQRLIMLFASLPGALIHTIGAHLPKDFFVDYQEPPV